MKNNETGPFGLIEKNNTAFSLVPAEPGNTDFSLIPDPKLAKARDLKQRELRRLIKKEFGHTDFVRPTLKQYLAAATGIPAVIIPGVTMAAENINNPDVAAVVQEQGSTESEWELVSGDEFTEFVHNYYSTSVNTHVEGVGVTDGVDIELFNGEVVVTDDNNIEVIEGVAPLIPQVIQGVKEDTIINEETHAIDLVQSRYTRVKPIYSLLVKDINASSDAYSMRYLPEVAANGESLKPMVSDDRIEYKLDGQVVYTISLNDFVSGDIEGQVVATIGGKPTAVVVDNLAVGGLGGNPNETQSPDTSDIVTSSLSETDSGNFAATFRLMGKDIPVLFNQDNLPFKYAEGVTVDFQQNEDTTSLDFQLNGQVFARYDYQRDNWIFIAATQSTANLRSGPGVSYDKAGSVDSSMALEVVRRSTEKDASAIAGSENYWFQLASGEDASEKWLYGDLITFNYEGITTDNISTDVSTKDVNAHIFVTPEIIEEESANDRPVISVPLPAEDVLNKNGVANTEDITYSFGVNSEGKVVVRGSVNGITMVVSKEDANGQWEWLPAGLENIEAPDEAMLSREVKDYAKAFGLTEADVLNSMRYGTTVTFDGKECVFAQTGDGVPLLMAVESDGVMEWETIELKDIEKIEGVKIGVGLTGPGKYHRDAALQSSMQEHFDLLRFAGHLRPDKMDSEPTRYEAAVKIADFANRNDMAMNLIPGVQPRYFPPEMVNASEQELLAWVTRNAGKFFDLIEAQTDGGDPTLVTFGSEAIYWSQRAGAVQFYTNQEDNPLYALYGENWLAKVYAIYIQQAQAKGLEQGRDYRMGYADNVFLNWRNNPQFTEQFYANLVQSIATELGIPVDQVQLDAEIELHVSGNPTADFPYVAAPTDQEMATLVSSLRRSGIDGVHVIEHDAKNMTPEQRVATLAKTIEQSATNGISSTELWNTYLFDGDPNSPFDYGPNGLISDGYEKTQDYYRLLAEVLTR